MKFVRAEKAKEYHSDSRLMNKKIKERMSFELFTVLPRTRHSFSSCNFYIKTNYDSRNTTDNNGVNYVGGENYASFVFKCRKSSTVSKTKLGMSLYHYWRLKMLLVGLLSHVNSLLSNRQQPLRRCSLSCYLSSANNSTACTSSARRFQADNNNMAIRNSRQE